MVNRDRQTGEEGWLTETDRRRRVVNRDRQEKKGGEQRQTGEEGWLTETDRRRRAVNRDRQEKGG